MPFVRHTVQFTIVTPDQLRRIALALTSELSNDQAENWIIDFEVWERNRNEQAFQLIGKIAVPLYKKDFDGARTIVQEGHCTGQRAQSLRAAHMLNANRDGNATTDDVEHEVVMIVRAE